MKKLFACLLTLTLACTFIACNNNVSGTSGAAESWSVVTIDQKERLVGTWKSTDTCENLPLTMNLVVSPIYETTMALYINYSSVPNEQVNDVVKKLKGMPYRFNDYDASHKVLKKTIEYTDFDWFMSELELEIDANGTKIRMQHPLSHDPNKKIVLTKQ